jgi:hypothetical protein
MSAPFIPEELKRLTRWNVWLRVGERKIPFGPETGRAQAWQDNLTTYDAAMAALHRPIAYAGESRKPDGVGFRLGGDYAGIDLDCAIYVVDGKPKLRSWALRIVDQARKEGAWIEKSLSGDGLHVILRKSGSEQAPHVNKWTVEHDSSEPDPRKPCQVEMYLDGQYFTVSGKPAKGGDATVIGCAPDTWALALETSPQDGRRSDAEPERDFDGEDTAAPMVRDKGATLWGSLPRGTVDSPMAMVNSLALARAGDLVPGMFPEARLENSAWKIWPDATGGAGGSTNAISIHAARGVRDFAAHKREGAPEDGKLSMIDLLLPPYGEFVGDDFQGCQTAVQAAQKLCDAMDMPWLKKLFRDDPDAAPGSAELVNVLARDAPVKVPEWPAGVLPAGLESYARHIARRRAADETTGCFTHFVAMAASIPQGVVYEVTGGGADPFRQHTSLYALLAGRSGMRKSPLLDAAFAPVEEVESEWRRTFEKAHAAFRLKQAEAEGRKGRHPKKGEEAKGEPLGAGGAFAPPDDVIRGARTMMPPPIRVASLSL